MYDPEKALEIERIHNEIVKVCSNNPDLSDFIKINEAILELFDDYNNCWNPERKAILRSMLELLRGFFTEWKEAIEEVADDKVVLEEHHEKMITISNRAMTEFTILQEELERFDENG